MDQMIHRFHYVRRDVVCFNYMTLTGEGERPSSFECRDDYQACHDLILRSDGKHPSVTSLFTRPPLLLLSCDLVTLFLI